MKYLLKTKIGGSYRVKGCPVLFVDTAEKVERALRILADSTKYGCDVEGKGCDVKKEHPFHKARLVSHQYSAVGPKLKGVHDAQFIFVPHWGKYRSLLKHFRGALEDTSEKKLFHNAKYDMHVFANEGIWVQGLKADTMVKAYLHNTGTFHGLKPRMKEHFGIEDIQEFDDVFRIPKLKKNGEPGKQTFIPDLGDVMAGKYDYAFKARGGAVKALVEYGVTDPYYTVQLDDYLDGKLGDTQWHGKHSMLDYYYELERDFTYVLFEMERRGCRVDVELMEQIRESVLEKSVNLERAFLKMCVRMGVSPSMMEDFNLGSSQQLGKLLEGELQIDLPRTKPSRTHPNGQPQTSTEALERVRGHRNQRLLGYVLEWRKLVTKLVGTYLDPFLKISREEWSGGRLRTQLKHTATRTFRLASSNPNLQNIPTPDDEDESDPFGIRKAFIPDDPETDTIGDADLSNIELRLMAHYSKDPAMIEVFHRGWDMHSRTATICFKEVMDYVNEENGGKIDADILKKVKENFKGQRAGGKTVSFLVAYGGGPKRYADAMGSSIPEGKRVIANLFKGYPGLAQAIKGTQAFCHQHGYVRTLFRRYVHIPEIYSYDKAIRAGAERKAWNYRVQGGAADMIKAAMVLIWRDDKLRYQYGVDQNLQIHDELMFNIPKQHKAAVKPILEEYISHAYRYFGMKDLLVDTPAELGFGPNWSEAK